MKDTISKKQLREFGLLIGFGFPTLIGWVLPSIFRHEFRLWTLWVGTLGLILGLTAPRLLKYPYKGWMALGDTLGWINSHIILGLVFILVLQPIAYIMRLTGYDPLRRRRKGDTSYREDRKDHKTDLKIGVTGCVAQAESLEIFDRQPAVDFIIGPQSYHKLPNIISKLENGERNIIQTSFEASDKFNSISSLTGIIKPSAFVTIQEGCDKFCTFCVVPYTRGKEVSRSQNDILNEIREIAAKGTKEVILLGQNVNAYNFEGVSLSSLIYSISQIVEIERIRFMTSHPKDMTDELINAFGNVPKLMPFLHLPVQSGSSKILKSMNRGHVVEEYVEIINRLRSVRKDICFSRDFIVGYPGETDEDFQETINLGKRVKFAQAYSFNYS